MATSCAMLERLRSGLVSENDGKTVLTATVVSETKQRFPATPYGFGATLSSLNEKQIAILGALGLTML